MFWIQMTFLLLLSSASVGSIGTANADDSIELGKTSCTQALRQWRKGYQVSDDNIGIEYESDSEVLHRKREKSGFSDAYLERIFGLSDTEKNEYEYVHSVTNKMSLICRGEKAVLIIRDGAGTFDELVGEMSKKYGAARKTEATLSDACPQELIPPSYPGGAWGRGGILPAKVIFAQFTTPNSEIVVHYKTCEKVSGKSYDSDRIGFEPSFTVTYILKSEVQHLKSLDQENTDRKQKEARKLSDELDREKQKRDAAAKKAASDF